jgi:hypothetical protein
MEAVNPWMLTNVTFATVVDPSRMFFSPFSQ